MADLALEAAAEAIKRKRFEVQRAIRAEATRHELAEAAIAAYLDSLLGGLPAEAVKAAARTLWGEADARDIELRDEAGDALVAALRSLRSGLERDGE